MELHMVWKFLFAQVYTDYQLVRFWILHTLGVGVQQWLAGL